MGTVFENKLKEQLNTMKMNLETDVSSSHAVAQLILVPNERHDAHVSLDVDGLIEDQDAVGLPRDRLGGVSFLGCCLELITEVEDLWTGRQEQPMNQT